MYNRSSGILLPISSLPSKYGIGTFGKEAFEFVDFLHKAGQKFWQILPIGPVSYGDSPYSPFSVYAGNPYYIDLDSLIEKGVLENRQTSVFLHDDCYIDYEKQFNNRYELLRKAYDNSDGKYNSIIEKFKIDNNWVCNYALFMALKYKNNQKPWYKWDALEAKRDERTIDNAIEELKEEINYWVFLQYLFYEQYFKLKDYANHKGIKIIGDLPIYAAEDSVDVWANNEIFMMDGNKSPIMVAGVPPDNFSDEGQLWGNPVYNWGYLKETHYQWWINRIKWSFELYDAVRIDHFRGFDEFWAVKYGLLNAIKGKWLPAYGNDLFDNVKLILGDLNIIAEDLGIITESVIKLKHNAGFPGMKIIQFAFDENLNNPYLPKNYEENCVAYTGTHDNDTLKGWFDSLDSDKKDEVRKSLNIIDTNNINYNIIKVLYDSKANICIIPLQDFLSIGSEGRINTPSTLGGNWTWRVKKYLLTEELANKIKNMVTESNRIYIG